VFEGEKTSLFWVGLLLLSFSSVVFFAALWGLLSYTYNPSYNSIPYYVISSNVPIMVGAIVFLLVGLYMMKEGVKKSPSTQQKLPRT
jgi:hypothetical protein